MDSRWLLLVPVLVTALSLLTTVWQAYIGQGSRIAATIASVPLVLPPLVVVYYFVFPVFLLPVVVMAACIFGATFMLRSAVFAFQDVNREFIHAARSLGASEWRVFWRIALPLAIRPILAAAAIVFLRTLLELAIVFWVDRR